MGNANLEFVDKHKSKIHTITCVDGKTNEKTMLTEISRDGVVWATGRSSDTNESITLAMKDAYKKGGPPERAETNEKITALASENAAMAKKIADLEAAAKAKAAEATTAKPNPKTANN